MTRQQYRKLKRDIDDKLSKLNREQETWMKVRAYATNKETIKDADEQLKKIVDEATYLFRWRYKIVND